MIKLEQSNSIVNTIHKQINAIKYNLMFNSHGYTSHKSTQLTLPHLKTVVKQIFPEFCDKYTCT